MHAELYGVTPVDGGDRWSDLSSLTFKSLVRDALEREGGGVSVTVKAVGPQLAVVLYSAWGVSLNNLLVASGHAILSCK